MKNIIFIIIIIFLVSFVAGCTTYKEVSLQENIETQDGRIVWTIIDFDSGKYDCNKNIQQEFTNGYRDLQTLMDMCVKQNALSLNNLEKCNAAKTNLIKDYCIVELNIKKNSDYCKDKNGIIIDFCTLIKLRDEHGYRPLFNADCSIVSDSNLKKFCEIAYSRKE